MTTWWNSMAAATLLGAVVGAVAAITAGLGAAWWTQRQASRRADTDRLFQGKLDAYADLMAMSAQFRAEQYHWDLWERRQRHAGAAEQAGPDGEAGPAGPAVQAVPVVPAPPQIDDDTFLAVAGRVRLLSSGDVADLLDELEALLFAARDVGQWSSHDAVQAARALSGLEAAVRADLGVR
jgi:hypothetical protein